MSGAAYSVAVKTRLSRFHLDAAFEGAAGVTVLFGPSGAGKSTILSAVAGALRPDAGRIVLGERTLFDRARRIDVPPERRAVGWVFQDARLFPHLSVEGNLRYGLDRAGAAAPAIAFDAVVEALGLAPLLQRRPLSLSGGEAQRVAIGRALLRQPELLLMDEPLSALDEDRRDEILTFIERVQGAFATPILYVTHSRAEARRLADRVVRLDRGAVVAQGGADLLAGPTAGASEGRLPR